MNYYTRKLKLFSTFYDSPHGLSNINNVSTAYDQAKLLSFCMEELLFKEIVKTKKFTCVGMRDDSKKPKRYKWENTNKLLGEGFCGAKTGVTPNAGPCLATCQIRGGELFICILLNSKTMDHRWIEAPKLINWSYG